MIVAAGGPSACCCFPDSGGCWCSWGPKLMAWTSSLVVMAYFTWREKGADADCAKPRAMAFTVFEELRP